MVDLLVSTGIRVGELVKLNREDIDFSERECIVLGKGDKERRVYFDAKTKIHLDTCAAKHCEWCTGRRYSNRRIRCNMGSGQHR